MIPRSFFRIASNAAKIVAGIACLHVPDTRAAEDAPPLSDDFLVQKWDADDGLPGNNISAITQTRDGWLWIGTDHGLARFDGVRFKTFSAANSPGLASDAVRFLSEEKNGALWIGLATGGIVRKQSDAFGAVTLSDPSALATSLALDAGGNMWAGSDALAALRWNGAKWIHLGAKDGLNGKGAVSLVASDGGKIWFTTETSYGFFDGRRFVTLADDVPTPQLLPRRAGGIWLARGNVLLILKENKDLVYGTDMPWRGGDSEIQTMCEDRAGALWIGTRSQGLFRFDGEFTRVPTSHNSITAIREDTEGNLWIGTWGGGLNRIRTRGIRIHDTRSGLPGDVVYSVCEDSDGALWFAMRSAGVVRFAGGQFTFFTEATGWPGGVLATVCRARGGGVWLGTVGDGLIRWRDGVFENVGLAGEHVESMIEDRAGNLWIGTTRAGLLMWRDGKMTRMPQSSGLIEITALAEDKAGHLWTGTRDGALFRYDGKQFTRFEITNNRTADAIQTILADDSGALWIGTRGGGLVHFKTDEVVRITAQNGLPDDDIRQIVADDAGNFWFGSLHGLFRASRRHLEEAIEDRRTTVNYIRYGRSDGFGSVEFTEGFCNAACRTRDGRLWFATHRGVVEADPKELLRVAKPPPVLIEEIIADGKSPAHSKSDGFDIPALTRKLEVRYTAPSFTAPDKVRFRHRLEDLEKNSTDAGSERVATFLNIPPGGHRFAVVASNGESGWSPAATIEFRVRAAVWQTLWYRVSAAILLLVCTGAAVRFAMMHRVRSQLRELERERALENERARIAKDMHDDLGARLTRIALLSAAARGGNGLAPGTASCFEKISRAAREVSQTLDEIVWTVNPGNDTLERVIGYIGEYAAEYLVSTGIAFQQDLPENAPAVAIASDVRHNLLMAVKEALSNAVKHSAATKISLRATLISGTLRVRIEDNGKGFAATEKRETGNGLANMRQRLAAAGGRCEIESRAGEGTCVTLTLRLRATK